MDDIFKREYQERNATFTAGAVSCSAKYKLDHHVGYNYHESKGNKFVFYPVQTEDGRLRSMFHRLTYPIGHRLSQLI